MKIGEKFELRPNRLAVVPAICAVLALGLNIALGLRLNCVRAYMLPGLLGFVTLAIVLLPGSQVDSRWTKRRVVITVLLALLGANIVGGAIATAAYLSRPDVAIADPAHLGPKRAAEITMNFSSATNPTGRCRRMTESGSLAPVNCGDPEATYAWVSTVNRATGCSGADRIAHTGSGRFDCLNLNWSPGACIATSMSADRNVSCDRPLPGFLVERPTKIVLSSNGWIQCGTDGGRVNMIHNYTVCTELIESIR